MHVDILIYKLIRIMINCVFEFHTKQYVCVCVCVYIYKNTIKQMLNSLIDLFNLSKGDFSDHIF